MEVRCAQRVHSSRGPPSAAVRHRAMASSTFTCFQRIHWRFRSTKAAPAVRMRSAISSAGGVTGAPPANRDHTLISKPLGNHCSARSCVASAAGRLRPNALVLTGLATLQVIGYTKVISKRGCGKRSNAPASVGRVTVAEYPEHPQRSYPAFRVFGASLEQAKEGSELVSATEATTWIKFAST